MEKSRAIELLKLAVPIKALTQQEYADFVEAVNMGMDALKQPEKAQLSQEGTTKDTISRQAALDAIDTWDKFGCDKSGRLVRLDGESESLFVPYIHYEDVVNAIKGLPIIQPVATDIDVGDTISRQAAIDVIEAGRLTKLIDAETAINGLRELPPVQSERKNGKWTPQKCGELCCSECGGYALDISDGNSINIIVPSNYCPHCGASMKNRHSIIMKDLN